MVESTSELENRVNEVMDKIYNSNSPSNATALEEELAKILKDRFTESYKKAANELNDPENEIPSPGTIAAYIPYPDKKNCLQVINNWFEKLE